MNRAPFDEWMRAVQAGMEDALATLLPPALVIALVVIPRGRGSVSGHSPQPATS